MPNRIQDHMSKIVRLRISALRRDPSVQSRVDTYQPKVDEYAEAMKRGETFPPIKVFFDGKTYWVADGFHRVPAAQQAGMKTIEADVTKGERRDAILYSVGCNSTHGLPRTRDDKWKAVEKLLKDPEWQKWSGREIARHCHVAWSFVGKVRDSICAPSTDAREVKFIRNGKEHLQKVRRRKMGRIVSEVMELLRDSPIADSPDEVRSLVSKSPEQQVKIATKIVAGEARTVKAATKKVRQEERRAALCEPPDLRSMGKYRTLVVDPPWPLEEDGRFSPENHYPTKPIEAIRALAISDIAMPDAHLYLWVVREFFKEGLELVEHWGFKLRDIITWVKTDKNGKPSFGSGEYFRRSSEHMLFAVRGDVPTARHDLADVIHAPKPKRHSEKPDASYELAEAMSLGPYIDVYARKRKNDRVRDGWDAWGNERGVTRSLHALRLVSGKPKRAGREVAISDLKEVVNG